MEKEKNKWIEEVFESTKGMQRARPNPALFSKIRKDIYGEKAKVIQLPQLGRAIAAAVLILILNVFVVIEYTKADQIAETATAIDQPSNQSILSNYNLYE